MKLFLVLDENIYQPFFISDFIKRSPDSVVGVALVTKMPKKSSLDAYFIKNWQHFRIHEIIHLLALKYIARIKDIIFKKTADHRFFNLRTLCAHYGIECFNVEYDIHRPEYLERIKKLEPDVIVSSNPLIFKKPILTLPKICCINRHFALLPAFRGLFAVFHAYAHAEKYTGCSFHLMDEGIDTGCVLSQKKLPLNRSCSLHELHSQCFNVAVDGLLEALDKIRRGEYTDAGSGQPASYFSWPTAEEWRMFRQQGGRII